MGDSFNETQADNWLVNGCFKPHFEEQVQTVEVGVPVGAFTASKKTSDVGRQTKRKSMKKTPVQNGQPQPHVPIKYGHFTAGNVTVDEIVFNNKVLRVNLSNMEERFRNKMNPITWDDINFINHCLNRAPKKTYGLIVQCLPQKSAPCRLTLSLKKLLNNVNVLKLPSDSWKVLVSITHDLNPKIKFMSDEKVVICSHPSLEIMIYMQGIQVFLLGCPRRVRLLRHLEILLEIVNRLDVTDRIIGWS